MINFLKGIRFVYGVTDGKNGKREKVDVDSLDLQYGWIYYKKRKEIQLNFTIKASFTKLAILKNLSNSITIVIS